MKREGGALIVSNEQDLRHRSSLSAKAWEQGKNGKCRRGGAEGLPLPAVEVGIPDWPATARSAATEQLKVLSEEAYGTRSLTPIESVSSGVRLFFSGHLMSVS
jgi:hypothetical protein